jgi:saposin
MEIAIVLFLLSLLAVSTQAQSPCSICEIVVGYIDAELANNATNEEIVNGLDDMCTKYIPIYTDDCKVFVNQYEPVIVAWILNDESPDQFCKQIDVCTTSILVKKEHPHFVFKKK